MEEKIRLTLLYDFYSELLTGHQREILADYIEEDLTVSEIAAEHEISRQAASDMIKRSRKILEDYENKLKLVDKFLRIRVQVEDIRRITDSFRNDIPGEFEDSLDSFYNAVLEDL